VIFYEWPSLLHLFCESLTPFSTSPFQCILMLLKFSYAAKEGHFVCRACNAPLYSAEAKFKSGCGWPAFDKCYKGAVATKTDSTFGMRRVEILCGTCGGHLGHVFEGERMTPTNERHCVNSVSTSRKLCQIATSFRISSILTLYRFFAFCI
jgi:methionine-R-sulfoxide reductase